MKIAYVSNSIIPSRTANSIHVMQMCYAFSLLGHKVTLFAHIDDHSLNPANLFSFYGVNQSFEILCLPKPRSPFLPKSIYYLLAFRRLLKDKGFDLVYGRYDPACLAGTWLKLPTILETHQSLQSRTLLSKLILRSLVKGRTFLKLVVISNALKNLYQRHSNALQYRIQVAHDAASPTVGISEPALVPWNHDRLNIGYIGHLYQGRGIEIIISCAKAIPDIAFHIIGGTESDLKHWRSVAQKEGVTNLTFHGYVPPNSVPRYREAMDILLAPYQAKVAISGDTGDTSHFMSPLKIFEYMASGKPFIASRLPVLEEVLEHDQNCLLAEAADSATWVEAINSLRDVRARDRLAENAFNQWRAHHTWEIRARRVLDEVAI